jgi:hypothetical protein
MCHIKKRIVPVACQDVCFMRILLCPEWSTARVCVAAKDMGIQNVQQFERSYTVLLYVTIICTHTELMNVIDYAQLLYRVTL